MSSEIPRQYLEYEGIIERTSVEDLISEIRKPNTPKAVYVNSPGGKFEFFQTLGPAIERQGITTLSGDVRSAAVILYLLGQNRLAYPDAQFFFHEVRTLVEPSGTISITEMEEVRDFTYRYMDGQTREGFGEWARQMKSAQNWFLNFMTERTGVNKNVFLNLMRKEATLSSNDAVRYGIVHRIVDPGSHF